MTEVVVIGGGHNGLVAAAMLARGGRNVLLLEARDRWGGRCAPCEFHPGYHVPGLLHDTSTFDPRVARELRLEEQGARFCAPGKLGITDGSRHLVLTGHGNGLVQTLDAAEADAWRAWSSAVQLFQPVIRQLLNSPAPPLNPRGGGELWQLGLQGLAMRRLGRQDMLELLRILPMSVADWLEEFSLSPLLAEGLAFEAVRGGFFGPRAAGTAANLLFHHCSAGQAIAGAASALVDALVSCCRRNGAELRTDARVQRIELRNGRVAAVALDSGEKISTHAVLSCGHPQSTFLDWIDPAELTLGLEREIRCIRTRGTAAQVHLALSEQLALPAPFQDVEVIRWGRGGLEGLEQVFDGPKYGQMSAELHLEIWLPSRAIADLAPPGEEVLSIWVQSVPYRPQPDWNEQCREDVQRLVMEKLTELDPEVHGKLRAARVLTPWDLEQQWGLVGGQIFHVERTLDQSLMLRPRAALSRYATPIAGLYLGGSGCHPGGGISGMPGYLAARTILDS